MAMTKKEKQLLADTTKLFNSVKLKQVEELARIWRMQNEK